MILNDISVLWVWISWGDIMAKGQGSDEISDDATLVSSKSTLFLVPPGSCLGAAILVEAGALWSRTDFLTLSLSKNVRHGSSISFLHAVFNEHGS